MAKEDICHEVGSVCTPDSEFIMPSGKGGQHWMYLKEFCTTFFHLVCSITDGNKFD